MLATSVHPPPNVSNDINDHSFGGFLWTGSFPKDVIGGWGTLISVTYGTDNVIFSELL